MNCGTKRCIDLGCFGYCDEAEEDEIAARERQYLLNAEDEAKMWAALIDSSTLKYDIVP